MNPDEALDDMLADLRATSRSDQLDAALHALAETVVGYYMALIVRGLPASHAIVLAIDLQRHQLGVQPS